MSWTLVVYLDFNGIRRGESSGQENQSKEGNQQGRSGAAGHGGNKSLRICFIGDSFVNGYGDFNHQGWPGRVCAAATARGHDMTCYNLGIRRNTSSDVAVRWRDEALRRLPRGEDGRLVFSFGANDTMIEDGRRRVGDETALSNFQAILAEAASLFPVLTFQS